VCRSTARSSRSTTNIEPTLRLIQFSDTHLLARPQDELRGVRTLQSLRACVDRARAWHFPAAALLLSGDLVQDEPAGYAAIRATVAGLGIPVLVIPGNHDLPDRLQQSLAGPPFQVGGTTTSAGDAFNVGITGGGLNPYVFFTVGAETAECFKTGNWKCSTSSTLGGTTGSIRLSHYWSEGQTSHSFTVDSSGRIGAVQCTISVNGNQSFDGGGSYSVTDFPTFNNYAVSSAAVGSGSGSITSFSGVTADRTANETTDINFSGLGANSRIDIGFTLTETRTDASVATCTIKKQGNSWALTVDSWNKPWLDLLKLSAAT